jgi:flavin-dependent dehydrogenase
LIDQHPTLAALLEGAQQVSQLAGQMPLESRARRTAIPGLVFLGDAAGFVDPITGQGMAQALLSAERLAAVLMRPTRNQAPAFDPSYARLRDFGRQRHRLLRDSVRLTRFVLALARRPILARQTLRVLGANPNLYRHLIGVAAGTRSLLRSGSRPAPRIPSAPAAPPTRR